MYNNMAKTAKKSGLQADVVKIEELNKIITHGVLMTPSLFEGGENRVAGRVPPMNEIVVILKKGV